MSEPGLLDVHRSALESWRHTMNLVGPGSVQPHYDDADRALAALHPTGHWVDLGTGAGFPGVVLVARHPQLTVELVDSRRKRCVFLEHCLDTAGVAPERARVRCMRVEGLEAGCYDGVTARAFAAPAAVLDHASRLLRPGGTVVLFLQGGGEVPEDLRFEVLHTEPYEVVGKARKAVYLVRRQGP